MSADSIKRTNRTKNWELLAGNKFSPRHSHATCVFKCPDDPNKLCLWLTGGWSEAHRTFDVEIVENENSDVWYSRDGADWRQVTALHGDFRQGVGNGDALPGGYVAPWYSRYGHFLAALDGDGDGVADLLVLAGGFAPLPSNDVWISPNGVDWRFDGFAPWSKRAYAGTTVFRKKLWLMGGTPLSNDVWTGSLAVDSSRDVGYTLVWEQILSPNVGPWTPRAGFCVVTQPLAANLTEGAPKNDEAEPSQNPEFTEHMLILGGLAESDGDPPETEGTRARNDVWKSLDGVSWNQVSDTSMIWGGRAFHGCVLLHSGYEDENERATSDPVGVNNRVPRILITGGGYLGTRGNNVVREVEAYTDAWLSHDGAEWTRANYEEGSKERDNLYSTEEW